jgi:CHAD domain-containing protein
MTKPPDDLLARPAPAAAALVGLALLDEARVGCGRLAAPEDAEALHDFRVALRRLRSVLRSFRSELGDAVPKKLQRRLRDVTRATGAARDAEVQLGWVRSHRADLGRRLAPGLPWLLARLAQQQDQAYAAIRRKVPPEFRQLERRVRRGLSATLLDASPTAPAFAASTSRLIREHVTELEQELAAARAGPDADAIHAARIAVKRLRYLLEPLAGERPVLAGTIESLKSLQDLLGELHDLHVLGAALGVAVAEAAAERARRLHAVALRGAPSAPRARARQPGPRPASAGLLALARFAGRTQDQLFRRLETEWFAGPLALLTQALRGFADDLTAGAVPPSPTLPRPRAARRAPLPSRYTRPASP